MCNRQATCGVFMENPISLMETSIKRTHNLLIYIRKNQNPLGENTKKLYKCTMRFSGVFCEVG